MNLLTKISYGLYVISTCHEDIDNGCMANTLIQQTENPQTFSVTLNNNNYTCELVKKSRILSAAILSTECTFELIKLFGMNKGNVLKKFDQISSIRARNNVLVPADYVIGYLELKVLKFDDLGSHTLFLCELIKNTVLKYGEPLTYAYYHANIKPKPVIGSKVSNICTICGYEHVGEISDGFICPLCKHGKEYFEKKEENKGEKKMSKYVCMVCGYTSEGTEAPSSCPLCHAPASKFQVQSGELAWAAEHVVGIAKGVSESIVKDLRDNFNGECCEVGMYLAMSRVAYREGYPEVGMYYEKAAFEEAEHAAKFAELLGEVVTDSTKRNLEMRIEAENGATLGKTALAKAAKEQNLDAIHDTVHEMARDEARHGKAFLGLYNRYFKK